MSMFRPSILGQAIRKLGHAVKRAAEYVTNKHGERKPVLLSEANVSVKEKELPVDAFSVKRKLGASYFTRRLHPRTRQRRLSSLTCEEARIARAHRWIR